MMMLSSIFRRKINPMEAERLHRKDTLSGISARIRKRLIKPLDKKEVRHKR
jgi:hypothetical protein